MAVMCRGNGLHQWDATLAATKTGKTRETVKITVFSDTREDAVRDACHAVQELGYLFCTVDHITKI